jgi:hypothetical protein
MTLKPWREIAVPHEDVLKGTFQQAEFAADLSRVHAGTATPEYQTGRVKPFETANGRSLVFNFRPLQSAS